MIMHLQDQNCQEHAMSALNKFRIYSADAGATESAGGAAAQRAVPRKKASRWMRRGGTMASGDFAICCSRHSLCHASATELQAFALSMSLVAPRLGFSPEAGMTCMHLQVMQRGKQQGRGRKFPRESLQKSHTVCAVQFCATANSKSLRKP